MAIPLLPSGMTPPVDWLSRRLFGSTKYLDPGVGEYAGKGIYNLGISYCRKIAGSSSWSNHAFGNALDIGIKPDDSPVGDQIAAWLRGPFSDWLKATHPAYSIAHLLWKVPSHHNHIHVDFNPYGTGTPPCAGGPQGPVAKPWPLDDEEDDVLTPTQVNQLKFTFLYDRGVSVGMGIGKAPTDAATLATEAYKAGLAVGQKLKALA